MRFARTISTVAFIFIVSLLSLRAQSQRPPGRPEQPEMLSAKERAEKRTDQMDDAVNLDKKQYKKIYRIFLKEEEGKDSAMGTGAPMGPPPPGGTGPGFSGNHGFGGPPSGGRPPHDGHSVPSNKGNPWDSDEYIDAREDKFKKILTPDQYNQWRKLHPDPTGFFIK